MARSLFLPLTDDHRPSDTRGIIAPFRIRPGLRVLEIGAGTGMAALELAGRGARLLALEPHPEHARAAEQRLAGHAEAQVACAWFFDWLESQREQDPRFDLILIHADDRQRRHVGLPWGLERDVAAAARLLARDGVVMVVADNPRGIRNELAGDAAVVGGRPPRAPVANAPDEPLDLLPSDPIRSLLERAGLPAQAWYAAWPFRAERAWLIDAAAWEQPGGAAALRWAIREHPVASAPEHDLVRSAPAVFARAGRHGLGLEVADGFVVAAARDRATLATVRAAGWAWSVPSAAMAPGWDPARVLRTVDGTWQLGTFGDAGAASGPYAVTPAPLVIPGGTSGEDALRSALGAGGPVAAETRRLVSAWSAAAQASAVARDDGWRPVDIGPNRFTIDAAGSWGYVPSELATRAPVPFPVLALRAMMRTVLPFAERGWRVPGLPAAVTCLDLARLLLEAADVRVDDATELLWLDLEADLLLRSSATPPPRMALRTGIRDRALHLVHPGGERAEMERVREELERRQLDVERRLAELERRPAVTGRRRQAALRPPLVVRLRESVTHRGHEQADRDLVLRSGLFDAAWYLAHNPDVREEGMDPLRHYLRHGGAEGRAPGPAFDGAAYLAAHPDVARSRGNPLVHHLRSAAGHHPLAGAPDPQGGGA